MGKAKRAKLKKIEEQERLEKLNAQKRAERRDTMKVAVVAVSILLVIAIVVTACCLVVFAIRSTGNYLRDRVAVTSEHYDVNNAMMSYFFHDTFNSSKSYYDAYASYIGLNTSMPLRDQTNSQTGQSWYKYFMDGTVENVKSMLVLAEAAKAAGVELTDIENARIDEAIDNLAKYAELSKVSTEKFIHETYGLGVKEGDVRDALKIYFLSQKFYYQTLSGIEVTTEEINKHYEENTDDYMILDYKVYSFKDTEKKVLPAVRKGELLAEAKTPEQFDEILRDLIAVDFTDEDKLDAAIKGTLKEGVTLVEKQEYSKWLFEDGRKVGDTKVIKADDGTVSVYMLVTEPHRDESATKDVRHILFSFSNYESKEECKAAAEAVLKKFKEDGASEEKFAELAALYSTDSGSSSNGGLYENVAEGQMVEPFEKWLFDDSRKVGDCDIVETTYGYHIMYYVGEGRPQWEASIFEELRSDKLSEISKEFTKKYPINVDSNRLNNIPDVA